MSLLTILALNFALIIAVMLLLWRIAVRIGDVSFIDAAWAYGMVLLAANSFWAAKAEGPRAWLILALTALWGLRLGTHLFIRWRAHGRDPRYDRILGAEQKKGASFARAALTHGFGMQGPLLWIVCLPAQVGIAVAPTPVGILGWAGAALALIGIGFETVGDAQLKAFRADPSNKGKVLDTGLWRYTRHPNYFGDACVWWGIWLIAAETGPGVWSIAGPILITFLLTRLSGVPMLEKSLGKTRPGYAGYVARTSSFIPWPPKRQG